MEASSDFIQQHPYMSMALGFVAGYGIIQLTARVQNAKATTATTTTSSTAAATADTGNTTSTNSNTSSTEKFYERFSLGNQQQQQEQQQQFPDVNPWAAVGNQKMTGEMSPVRWNKTTDVRGEPAGVRSQQVPVESAFLKNPRATEARIDELEVKSLRKPRAIEY
jgi:hypothetical protein